jgi:hypothetical protein
MATYPNGEKWGGGQARYILKGHVNTSKVSNYFADLNLVFSEDKQLCLAGKDTAVIMALAAITLPVRGDENLVTKEQEKASKVIRQIDIEGGKTIAKVFSPFD